MSAIGQPFLALFLSDGMPSISGLKLVYRSRSGQDSHNRDFLGVWRPFYGMGVFQ
jgi:hypothetical protein